MEKTKKILFKILFPHISIVILVILIAVPMLIYGFAYENVSYGIQYISYVMSAYGLTIFSVRIPNIIRYIKTIKHNNKYAKQYFTKPVLRVKVSLYSSLAINIIYAIMQLGLGIYNQSIWFYALSVYYLILATMRFFLLRETKKTGENTGIQSEYIKYRICGIFLLPVNIALSIITAYIVNQGRGFSYHYIITIAMAAYTFTTFTVAIVNVIRYKKYNSPIMSASKIINFAAALVSMLSLETAMLNAFGRENSWIFKRIITSATGGVVCTIILVLAAYMIVHSTKKLSQLRRGEM